MNAHTRNKTSGEYLADAKAAIERDEANGVARNAEQRDLHMQAANDIAHAQMLNPKLTQRKIAEYVGKSAAWVNTLIIWQTHGFKTSTAFGPQAKEARAKAERLDATKQEPEATKRERLARDKARAEAATAKAKVDEAKARAKAEQSKAKAKAEEEKTKRARDRAEQQDKKRREKQRKRKDFSGLFGGGRKTVDITEKNRTLLIRLLGALGKDNEFERALAAKKVDDLVKKLCLPNGWEDLIVKAA